VNVPAQSIQFLNHNQRKYSDGWKEFLKPSWKKIGIAIIVFIFFPIPIYMESSECFIEMIGAVCEKYWTISFYGLGLFDSILQGPIVAFEDMIILLRPLIYFHAL
jgi:hypothetical protein